MNYGVSLRGSYDNDLVGKTVKTTKELYIYEKFGYGDTLYYATEHDNMHDSYYGNIRHKIKVTPGATFKVVDDTYSILKPKKDRLIVVEDSDIRFAMRSGDIGKYFEIVETGYGMLFLYIMLLCLIAIAVTLELDIFL
jgi:tRNA A58 N-methylase Trm61